jgi:FkbM family methyltransferase
MDALVGSTKPLSSVAGQVWRDAKRGLRSVSPRWLLNLREVQFYAKHGEVELHLLDILCDPRLDAIDVGANDGVFIHFLRGQARTVHAYEPLPALVDNLRRKFPGGNVVIHSMALSREVGTIDVYMPVEDGVPVTGCATVSSEALASYPAHRSLSVPMCRLDSAYEDDVGFIKIDVEGHQQAVLDGAVDTFRRCRPVAMVEVIEELSPGGFDQARAFFDARGYSGYFVQGRDLLPWDQFVPEVLQNPRNRPGLVADLRDGRRDEYLYNFLFFPREVEREKTAALRARLQLL